MLERVLAMDKKYLTSLGVMLVCAFLVVLLGNIINLWDVGFNIASLIGFLACVPACIWAYFKGVNFVNSAVYFAGIGFIMYKNIFNEINARFVIICVLLCALAVIFPSTVSLFKKDENTIQEQSENEKGNNING